MGTEDEPEGEEARTTTDVDRVEQRFRGGDEAATAAAAGHVGDAADGLRQTAAAGEGGGGAVQQSEQGRVAGDETGKDARSGEGGGIRWYSDSLCPISLCCCCCCCLDMEATM